MAPPQTVFLFKRHIFKIENMVYDPQSAFYPSKSCLSALSDRECVPGSAGTNPENPMELVITNYKDEGNPHIEIVSMKPEYSARPACIIP